MSAYQELKNSIIKELFKNKEYAEFLCGQNLADISIIDMICAAPIPLTRKAEMLKDLSLYQDGNEEDYVSYNTYYDEIQKALDQLDLKDGEIYLCVGKTREYGEETQFESFPSKSIIDVYGIVNEETDEGKDCSDDYDNWYILEKWRTATEEDAKREYLRGDMVRVGYTYTFVNGEICYFDNFWERFKNKKEYRIKAKFTIFYSGSSLNLPTPWKEGDILEIDSTPFTPKTRVVVISTCKYCDCCFPCCLYLTENDVNVGALKHSHFYNMSVYENISPLYSAKRFTEELAPAEKVLKTVADYVKGRNEHGEEIFNLVTDYKRKKGEGDSGSSPITARILSLCKQNAGDK